MIPGRFEYHAATGVDEAIRLLTELEGERALLAGGHSLLPMMKLRFAEPAHLIDLGRIAELRGIREEGGELVIGPMTTEAELLASELLGRRCPLLPEVARQIADPQVRNRGTLGGDALHGDPANDHPAVLAALGARFVIRGPRGQRESAADGFYLGPYLKDLQEDELVTAIRIPLPADGHGHAYCKLKRKTGDWATAAAACILELDGDRVSRLRLTLTNLGPTPIRVHDAEALLTGETLDAGRIEQAGQAAAAATDPAEDLRGSAEYKAHVAGEMARRALRLAQERAGGGAR